MEKLRDMINESNEKLIKDNINTLQVYCEYFSNYDTFIITNKYNEDRMKAWKDMHNFAMFLSTRGDLIDMTYEEISVLSDVLLFMTSDSGIGYWKKTLSSALYELFIMAF